MMRPVFFLLMVFVAACFPIPAHAGMKFGSGEEIRFVANTTLRGPSGEQLFLARKVTMHSFIAPYSIDDDGFVLGVSGDADKYYPLPEGEKLQALQASGTLPNPLPDWQLSTVDQVFGHMLWILLIVLVPYLGIKLARNRRAAAPANVGLEAAWQGDKPQRAAKAVKKTPIALTPISLNASKSKYAFLIFLALAFVAAGILIVVNGKPGDTWMGWAGILFFGAGVPLFLKEMINNKPRLVIDQQGILDRTLGIGVIPWEEITGASLRSIKSAEFICLEVRDEDKLTARFSPVKRALMSANKALGFTAINLNLSGIDVDANQILELIEKYSAANEEAVG